MRTVSISGEPRTVSISGENEPRTVSISGERTVSIRAATPRADAQGLFGTKLGTAEHPFPIVSDLIAKATGVTREQASEALLVAAREPERKAREGFDTIINAVAPAPTSKGIVRSNADVNRDVLRSFLQAGGEFSASHISPEAGVVSGAGLLAKPFIAPAAKLFKAIGSKIAEKAPGLARPFVYRFGQPEAYKELAETRLGNIGAGAEQAGEVGTALSQGLSRAEQLRAGQILKGGVSTSAKETPLREAADKARSALAQKGAEAVGEGLLDEKTYLKNIREYMPRLYRFFEEKTSGLSELFGSKPQRIKGERFLKRGEISEDMKAFLGEIKEPAYPVARGIAQLTHDVETAKLFRQVSENPSWASAAPVEGFVKMDTTKRLGALAGRYVHPEIARDINEMIRVPSNAEKIYKDILHAWKFGKVILNPATHMRNMFSNSILLDLSGVEFHQQPRLLAQAAKEIADKGQYFADAKSVHLLGHEFSGAEIKGFIDNFEKAGDTSVLGTLSKIPGKAARIAGNTYQTEEQVFKLAKFIHSREAGMGIKEAAQEAEKWLFNYDKIPPFIRALRQSPIGAPFVTFTAKALPVVAETAIKHPMRLYKYKILFDSLENMAKEKFDISDQDIQTIKRNQRGSVVILPFKDKQGHLQTLDLSYILPWGDIGEQGGAFGLPPSVSPGGIVKPFAEVAMNKSLFKSAYSKFDPKKAQIYLDSDPLPTKVRKSVDYIYKSMMPSFAPPIPGISAGGYHTEKLIKAQEGKADYFGRVRSVSTVLADVFLGLKASPVDPELLSRFERMGIGKEIAEIGAEVKAKYRNKGLTEEEKQEARQVMTEKLNALILRRSKLNQ